ncbi:MAG: hypothetical protein ACYTF7_05570 [Planctomycetota bacterium]|jgi:hypothetical protein
MARGAPVLSFTGARCGVLILAIGLTCAQLLSLRQSRIVAASELTESMHRRAEFDRGVMMMRLEIAKRTTPEHIARFFSSEQLRHIPLEWAPPPLTPLFVETSDDDEVLP